MYKYVVVVSCMYKNCVRSRQRDLLGQSRQMLSVFVCGLVGWLAIFLSFISSYLYCRVNARFLKRRPILVYPGYQRFFLACVGELRFVGRRPTRVRPKAGERHERRSREKKLAGHFLILDRNRKPRMKSLWEMGWRENWIRRMRTTGTSLFHCPIEKKCGQITVPVTNISSIKQSIHLF